MAALLVDHVGHAIQSVFQAHLSLRTTASHAVRGVFGAVGVAAHLVADVDHAIQSVFRAPLRLLAASRAVVGSFGAGQVATLPWHLSLFPRDTGIWDRVRQKNSLVLQLSKPPEG